MSETIYIEERGYRLSPRDFVIRVLGVSCIYIYITSRQLYYIISHTQHLHSHIKQYNILRIDIILSFISDFLIYITLISDYFQVYIFVFILVKNKIILKCDLTVDIAVITKCAALSMCARSKDFSVIFEQQLSVY